MIRFMMVMVPLVFLINGFTKHDWRGDVLFLHRCRRRIDAGNAADDCLRLPVQGRAGDIEKESHREATQRDPKLGAMDVLCTDKTGTLTMDKVILERHCDVMRTMRTPPFCSMPFSSRIFRRA